MMIPNRVGYISQKIGNTVRGQPIFSQPRKVPCAIVTLDAEVQKTSVRADSSASRGNIEEAVSVAKILFPAVVKPKMDDKFIIDGFALRFRSAQPRYDVTGKLDHWDCDFDHWSD